ncbi:MAG: hypothetical protein HYZ83_05605 [Candidatus Omnitrophica bacterium]|nr:hypothetical protein [Candidatus Omnitrophota bacterium]
MDTKNIREKFLIEKLLAPIAFEFIIPPTYQKPKEVLLRRGQKPLG